MKFLDKFFKILNLKKLANIKALAKLLGYTNPANLIRDLLKKPMNLINRLDKLGVEGRKKLGQSNLLGDVIERVDDKFGEDKGPGTIEEQILHSSWQFWGQFEYTTNQIGTLWLQTKYSPKVYMFPNFPSAVWDLMKAARGSNGTGSGTVFWNWYRKFRTSHAVKELRRLYEQDRKLKAKGVLNARVK